MLVRWRTGEDPESMTFVKFNGIIARIHKIKRYETGGGITREEQQIERMAAMKEEQDDLNAD